MGKVLGFWLIPCFQLQGRHTAFPLRQSWIILETTTIWLEGQLEKVAHVQDSACWKNMIPWQESRLLWITVTNAGTDEERCKIRGKYRGCWFSEFKGNKQDVGIWVQMDASCTQPALTLTSLMSREIIVKWGIETPLPIKKAMEEMACPCTRLSMPGHCQGRFC